jgi:hypothetical protein
MKLGTPMFMEHDEAEKIAKRTFKPAPSSGLGIILSRNTRIDSAARCCLPDLQFAALFRRLNFDT